MNKWIMYSVTLLLIISVIVNMSLYRDKVSKEHEYVELFASAINITHDTLYNLQKSENNQTYLYHLLRNLEKMDTLLVINPSGTYSNYFKYYSLSVHEVLTNPDLEYSFDFFELLQQDINVLNDRLFENYVLKVDSLKEFEDILFTVILANDQFL